MRWRLQLHHSIRTTSKSTILHPPSIITAKIARIVDVSKHLWDAYADARYILARSIELYLYMYTSAAEPWWELLASTNRLWPPLPSGELFQRRENFELLHELPSRLIETVQLKRRSCEMCISHHFMMIILATHEFLGVLYPNSSIVVRSVVGKSDTNLGHLKPLEEILPVTSSSINLAIFLPFGGSFASQFKNHVFARFPFLASKPLRSLRKRELK